MSPDAGLDASADASVDAGDAGEKVWGSATSTFGPFYGSVSPPRVVAHASSAVFVAWTVIDGANRSLYVVHQALGAVGTVFTSMSIPALAPPGGVEIATTSGSTAVLVWVESTPRLTITTGYYSTSNSLSRVGAIDSAAFGDSRDPRLTSDGFSAATAAWRQGPDGGMRIFANQFNVSQSTWGIAPVLVSSDAGNADPPELATTLNWTSFVVWSQSYGDVGAKSVMAVRGIGSVWDDAGIVDAPPGESSESPTVVVSLMGQAVALWSRGAPAPAPEGSIIWSASTDVVGTWSGSSPIGTYQSDRGERPRAVIGSEGIVDAVWRSSSGQVLWSARNIDGGAWAPPGVAHVADAGAIRALRLASDGARRLFVVWEESGSVGSQVRLIERAPSAVSWDAVATLGGEADTAPDIAVDPMGQATAVWITDLPDAGKSVFFRQKR